MKLQEALNQVGVLTEEVIRVLGLKTGFNKVLPSGTNYTDSHATLPIFGNRWGRGVIIKSKNGLDAIIGSYGSSHAQLKKNMVPGEVSSGTFYYGFDARTKTLYLEYGSDRTFDFNNGPYLNAIMNSLKSSNGFMKNFILQR